MLINPLTLEWDVFLRGVPLGTVEPLGRGFRESRGCRMQTVSCQLAKEQPVLASSWGRTPSGVVGMSGVTREPGFSLGWLVRTQGTVPLGKSTSWAHCCH